MRGWNCARGQGEYNGATAEDFAQVEAYFVENMNNKVQLIEWWKEIDFNGACLPRAVVFHPAAGAPAQSVRRRPGTGRPADGPGRAPPFALGCHACPHRPGLSILVQGRQSRSGVHQDPPSQPARWCP